MLHLEDDDMEVLMMEAWLWWWFGCFDWWHGGVALMMTWCFGWWRFGLDDVLVDRVFGMLMIWRQFSFYTLPVSWSLPPLRVGFLKPLLVGSKRLRAGSCKKSWYSYLSWYWEIWEDWSLPQHIVSNGFYQYIIEFSIHICCLSSMWLIYYYDALMINKGCV